MECFIAFLICLVLFVVSTGTFAGAQARAAKRRRAYRHVAKRFAGQCLPGGLFGRPGIRFRYGATRALYREARATHPLTGRGGEMRLDWPNARLHLELYRDPEQIRPAGIRSQVVGIGEREFETDYVIKGRDEAEIAKLLSEGVRWQLNRLRLLAEDDNVYFKIQHGRMTVQKPTVLRRADELAEFVQLVFELYDQAMLTQVEGIDFVDADVAQPLEGVICKVCGDTIDHDMVCCQRCKTPHHHDCWTYNGACSVYGCQETQYVAPRSARTAPQPAEADSPAESGHRDSKPVSDNPFRS